MPRDKNIFTLNPTSLDMKRSVFPRNSQHKTSFNLGEIVPIFLDEILPGDTVSMDLAEVIRTSSPLTRPLMDNLYADIYAFFIPNRLVWTHWQQFCGEADTQAWTQTTTYRVPVDDIGGQGHILDVGCIGDYFGLPIKDSKVRSSFRGLPDHLEVSELPLRAYYKVYNDWFRDENSIAPVVFSIGDNTNTAIYYSNALKKASRFHDLFSSCLPAPQKGASVPLPLGNEAPIMLQFGSDTPQEGALEVSDISASKSKYNLGLAPSDNDAVMGVSDGNTTAGARLFADLSNATAATINQLRYAFQIQKLLEKDARGGTRYIELLRAHFGVTSPDARLQRSEYLAGHRFRINVDQVIATADSGASGSSIVGEPGAYSKTSGASSLFTKSFVEHGMLIIFAVIRQDHTYSQGLEKYWLKRDRFDFYYPVLANIGEVPVYKSEINLRGGSSSKVGKDSGVFGYQEAWYEYRYRPSRTSGYLNPIIDNSLNDWTIGDAYAAVPGLNQTFLEESPDFLDRCLTVQSSAMHQFIADFYFKAKYSRVMPVYSVPGLIDHH